MKQAVFHRLQVERAGHYSPTIEFDKKLVLTNELVSANVSA